MVAGGPTGPKYRAFALALGLSLFGGAGPHGASAAEPGAPSINPTGRILDMAVPLHYRAFYLGDLAIRITPEQAVLLPLADLLRLVSPLLRPEAVQRLKQSGGAGQDYADLARLAQAGFAFSFDPAAVQVIFEPTIKQKAEGNISIHTRQEQVDSPNRAEPADFAAFLNLRSGADYVAYSGSGNEGLKAPRLDLEGAIRWKDLVLESEGTYEPGDASFFGQGGAGFKRRGTRLIRDFEDEAIRVTAGDIYTLGSRMQATPDIVGISVERSVSKLQPGRNTRATGGRSFRLERPSNVDVVINGLRVRKLRLDPGDYNLSDLPISAGSNDLTLLIEDDVGHTQKLEFSMFSDSTLLSPGEAEWSLAAGVLTDFRGGEPAYDADRPFISGFYRRGLSESLTGETHMQGDGETVMSGAGVLFGSSLGLFALDAAASLQREGGWGAALNGDYALANIEDFTGRQHRFRLSAKLRTPEFTLPDAADGAHGDWLGLSASYGTQLPLNIAASVSAGYGFGQLYGDDSYGADLSLSRPFGRALSMGVAAGYHVHDRKADDLSVSLRLQYRPDDRSDIAATYDGRSQRSTLAASREFGTGVGGWQTSVDITREQPERDSPGEDVSLNAAASYTGNRANVSVSQDSRFLGLKGDVRDQRTSLRLETAIAVADGHVAVGRPVSNGFAIVTPHAGLKDNMIGVGKGAGGYQARTDFLGPALLPSVSPYTLNRLEYDVADLPPGYDLGDGVFDLQPRHKSGYVLKVGSDYTVTALGTLQDTGGAPLSLLTGTAIEQGGSAKKVEIFTNRDGRFSAQGLAPGDWTIDMATEPATRFLLRVPGGHRRHVSGERAAAAGWRRQMRLDFLARRTFGACGGSAAEAGQGHAAEKGRAPGLGQPSAAGLIRAASRSGVPRGKAQYSATRTRQRARATRRGAMVLMTGLAAIMNAGIASACSGRLSGVTGVDAAYAPFEAMNASKAFSITVQNTGATECIFWLGGWRVATVGEAASLNFELRGRDGTLPSAGAASPTAPAWLGSRRLAPNESHDFALVLAIPAGQVLPPGDYAHTFQTVLHAAPDARPPQSAEPLASRGLKVSIAVPAHLSINIAGAGVRKTIDFGELAEGERRQVRIETRSNQRFQLDVMSRNGGVLAMAPPYEASQVPYAVVLDGKSLKLPDTVGPFAGTGLAGSQFDIAFKIGGIVNKRAGLYRDEVTIEIRPVI